MKRNFMWCKKVLAVAATGAMLFSVTGCLNINSSSNSSDNSQHSITSSGSGDGSIGSGQIIDDEVEAKAGDIQDIIDNYFYFGANEEDITENVYKGMMEGLDDPYSVYYTSEEYSKLQEDTSGEYVGVGVLVSQDPETMRITCINPFKGGPAAEAGIKKGDIIVGVDDVELTDQEVSEVVKLIKGEEGTSVKLKVYREGETDYLEFDVTRAKVENPTVEYEMLADNIGYIQISEFYDVTADQYIAAVEDLKKQGMTGLIVDVRDNPGGLLTSVVDILEYMLPEGKIVYTADKNGNIINEYNSTDDEQFTLPLVVLANGNSASAAEIYTGAIKDYGLGTIVGTQTFGKGIVQRIFPLDDGSAVKLTIAKYFTPNGNDIHKVGIAPDVEVELSDEALEAEEFTHEVDNQLQEAIKIIKKK